MNCTKCSGDTIVLDSRPAELNQIRRRRECVACKTRVTTWESTIPAGRVRQLQKAKAERQNRYYHALDPDKRKAMLKRQRLRHDAREEARRIGKPVDEIYAQWGVT